MRAGGARHHCGLAGCLQFLPVPERAPARSRPRRRAGRDRDEYAEDDALRRRWWRPSRTSRCSIPTSRPSNLYRLFHERAYACSAGTCTRMLMLADGVERMLQLPAGRPRSHGRERQDHGHLRVLQFDLRVRAHGRERGDDAIVASQLIVRSRCGVSRRSKCRCRNFRRRHSPCRTSVIKPDDVGSGTPLVYSKFSPGLSTGSSPTRRRRAPPAGGLAHR